MPALRDPLNIVYVGTLPPHPGGSAISASQLLAGLAGLGHSVRAIAPITPDALAAGDVFAARVPEIAVTRFLMPGFETTPYLPPPVDYRRQEAERIQRVLSALIDESRPDAVFIGRETFAWHVPDVTERHCLPTVMRVAGATLFGMLRGDLPPAEAASLMKQFGRLDLLVTPARHMAESLRRAGISRVEVIPNALDVRRFSPGPRDPRLLRELSIRDGDVVVLYPANLHRRKRPMDLLASAEQVLHQDDRIVFVVLGDGPLRAVMEERCREKDISRRFRFAGWVDYARMPDYMNLADVVVMPSEGEGLARVYLEAQACAKVLVASDIPPAREVVTHAESGLLFRLGDVADLAEKILLAATNPRLRREIGSKARARVQAHGLEHAVPAYQSALREIVAGRRR
jgi:glycosyltransferase involved in cell wall biosynthesis